ncbi:MAG: DUF1684 domain-containing protein [Luteimonas sp.]
MGKTREGCFAAVVLLVLGLAGCGGEGGGGAQTEAGVAAATAASADFTAQQDAWRAGRHERLVAPDGWTGLIGLYWIELDAHYVGSSRDSGMRLSKGPPRLGLVQRNGGRTFFTPERGADLTVDGKPLTRRIELHADRSEAPTLIDFDDGLGQLSVIERAGRQALRVRHQEAESRLGFAGIDYWPADASWEIRGRFVAHPPGQTLEIASVVGGTEPMANPGVVEFERDGQAYRLEALDDGEGGLFLILADRTSGHGSYGAGRYLDAAAPDAEGSVMLDFNRAYNPPCAFTNYATCPLPPLDNRLDLAITAGEKAHAPPAG